MCELLITLSIFLLVNIIIFSFIRLVEYFHSGLQQWILKANCGSQKSWSGATNRDVCKRQFQQHTLHNETEKKGQEKLRTFYIIPWWRLVYHSDFGWTFTLIDKMNFFKANKKEMEKRRKEKPSKDQKKTFHLSCWNHVEHWTLMLRSIKHVTKRHKMSYSIQFKMS